MPNPGSDYLMFFQEEKEKLKSLSPCLHRRTKHEMTKMIARKWHNLDALTRAEYAVRFREVVSESSKKKVEEPQQRQDPSTSTTAETWRSYTTDAVDSVPLQQVQDSGHFQHQYSNRHQNPVPGCVHRCHKIATTNESTTSTVDHFSTRSAALLQLQQEVHDYGHFQQHQYSSDRQQTPAPDYIHQSCYKKPKESTTVNHFSTSALLQRCETFQEQLGEDQVLVSDQGSRQQLGILLTIGKLDTIHDKELVDFMSETFHTNHAMAG